jgi:hypothetical protein
VSVTAWPIWRLLVWLELWLLTVAAFHAWRPIHPDFVVPLLIGVVPAAVMVAIWGVSRGATEQRPSGHERATWIELLVAASAAIAAAGWVLEWALQAHADVQRIDAMLGEAIVIVDVSLTGLSLVACFAALTLDGLLAAAEARLRDAMRWLRRTHVVVTIVMIAALFGAAWLVTQAPDTGTAANIAYFERARVALHVYEYCKATVFPVQTLFAAMAVALTTAAHYER